MTNAEYYREQLKKLEIIGDLLAVRNGKPAHCTIDKCSGCLFMKSNAKCDTQRRKWLEEEHK